MNVQCIGVVGLGYVGLPLVIEFGKQIKTIGFDVSIEKVQACRRYTDPAQELTTEQMRAGTHCIYTSDPRALNEADVIIVAVPTPVDSANTPDFSPLINASVTVGSNMKIGAVVVFESTVYPGATEEICIPVLERESKRKWKEDFFVGYSPERINPGDRDRTLTKIIKIVSGDTPQTLETVSKLYERIIQPGVYQASSIRTAEAAKVIENTQRDLNIALMNELAVIFDKLGIDTNEVLEAAGTKWNFLKFKPGLVGGHCIGVDPYYLTHKAQMVGYHPQVILAGRRVNDNMGKYIAEQTIKHMISAGSMVRGAHVNVLGLTFKENCADIRNSKVIDIIRELESYGVAVSVTDPHANPQETNHEYGVRLIPLDQLPLADAIVAAVSHTEFCQMSISQIGAHLLPNGTFIDVKGVFDATALRGAGYTVWRL